jgi:hypothetical protein
MEQTNNHTAWTKYRVFTLKPVSVYNNHYALRQVVILPCKVLNDSAFGILVDEVRVAVRISKIHETN